MMIPAFLAPRLVDFPALSRWQLARAIKRESRPAAVLSD
jgi:hypothetical protein